MQNHGTSHESERSQLDCSLVVGYESKRPRLDCRVLGSVMKAKVPHLLRLWNLEIPTKAKGAPLVCRIMESTMKAKGLN